MADTKGIGAALEAAHKRLTAELADEKESARALEGDIARLQVKMKLFLNNQKRIMTMLEKLMEIMDLWAESEKEKRGRNADV